MEGLTEESNQILLFVSPVYHIPDHVARDRRRMIHQFPPVQLVQGCRCSQFSVPTLSAGTAQVRKTIARPTFPNETNKHKPHYQTTIEDYSLDSYYSPAYPLYVFDFYKILHRVFTSLRYHGRSMISYL